MDTTRDVSFYISYLQKQVGGDSRWQGQSVLRADKDASYIAAFADFYFYIIFLYILYIFCYIYNIYLMFVFI